MHTNQNNFVLSDQTYLYDFAYKKRVDLIASLYFGYKNYNVIVFGFRDSKKRIISSNSVTDLTVLTRNKLISFILSFIKCRSFISGIEGRFIVENLFSTFPIYFSSQKKLFHFDLHGEVVDELRILKRIPEFIVKLLYRYELNVLIKCDSISVCSQNHKKSIQYRLAGSLISKKIDVFPNIAPPLDLNNENDFIDREFEVFIQNTIPIVYSGSSLAWQSPMKMLSFFQKLYKYNDKYSLLILSRDLNDFNKFLLHVPDIKHRVFICQCEFEMVSYYYSKCKFGLVFRDFSRTNFVSNPTKIEEYAKSNLGILYTGHIGDFYDKNNSSGGLINCDDDIEVIENKMNLFANSELVQYNFN